MTLLKIMCKDLTKDRVETLVVPVCEDAVIHDDRQVAALARTAGKMAEFSGENKQEITFYNPRGIQADRVVFIGMGKKAALDREGLRAAAGRGVRTVLAGKLSRVCFIAPSEKKTGLGLGDILASLMEGAFLANDVSGTYKKKKQKQPLKEIAMLVPAGREKEFSALRKQVTATCGGTLLARRWVNKPANLKPPAAFANEIVRHADRQKLKTTIVDDRALKRKKFGAMLAVGAGSANKPRLVILEYTPAKKALKTVVLVGKGVVFDSGGLNLKPGASMGTMKTDMAGAATVAATLVSTARLKPDVRVVGVMPLVENMPSGRALRPGDIVTSHSGKTIEVGNTDAEGRLILADAMSWAVKTFKPDVLVDVATLTGACVMALGEKIAGVFSRDADLSRVVVSAGEKTFERCWSMPMPDDYKVLMKSELADINNMSSTRYGGAITAALFLSEFAGDVPWVHIDIAGPARNGKASDYCPVGGSGFGVRLLLDMLGRI
jgi:leucyl aminopeptidase